MSLILTARIDCSHRQHWIAVLCRLTSQSLSLSRLPISGSPPFAASYSPSSLLPRKKKTLSFTRFSHSDNVRNSRNFSIRASSSGDSFVTLLDYGAGNVRSVRNAIRFLGFEIKDVQTPQDILNASRLVFPGVGAFAPAMEVLTKTGMGEALCSYIEKDRPFLGICLGLQLFFGSSKENGASG